MREPRLRRLRRLVQRPGEPEADRGLGWRWLTRLKVRRVNPTGGGTRRGRDGDRTRRHLPIWKVTG
ncbi:MAG: hypothetical protein WKF75_11535 [Singulisphaera sp.]